MAIVLSVIAKGQLKQDNLTGNGPVVATLGPYGGSPGEKIFQRFKPGQKINATSSAMLVLSENPAVGFSLAIAHKDASVSGAIAEIVYWSTVKVGAKEVKMLRTTNVVIALFGEILSVSEQIYVPLEKVQRVRLRLVRDLRIDEFWNDDDNKGAKP